MARTGKGLLHGTLDTLILKTVSQKPLHGYAIARWIESQTGETIQIEEGSLYPALYRLEKKGLLRSEWGRSELDRRAKFYHLTDRGHAKLEAETDEWLRFSTAVTHLLAKG